MKTPCTRQSRPILSTSIAALCLLGAGTIKASVTSLPYGTVGSSYTQNFDALPSSGTFTLPSAGPLGLDASPLAFGMTGWEILNTVSANVEKFTFGTGSSNSGSIYSFGATGTNPISDRALGSVASGTVISNFGLVLTNTTGVTLNQITITFDGEQWRDGGNTSGATQALTFSYGFGADINSAGYTSVAGLTFTSPTHGTTGTGVALDGNAAANRVAGLTATINALNWTNGSTLVLQWNDINDLGNDHGLAIDNFSFVANAGSVIHNLTWNAVSGNWDASTPNWTGDATTFTNLDNVTFSSASGGTITIQTGGVAPHNVIVSAPSGTYTFQNTVGDTNGIAGDSSTNIAKSGGGTLVLASQNTYGGGTVVTGGTLQMSNNNQLGAASSGLTLDGGALSTTAGLTLARGLTVGAGGGTLATNGSAVSATGTTTLNGVLSVTGAGALNLPVVVNFGTTGALNIGAGSTVTLSVASGSMTMNAGGVFDGDLVINTTALVRFNGTATSYGGAGKIKVLGSAIGAGSGGVPISNGAFTNFNGLLTGFQTATITSEIVLNPSGTGHVPWVPGNITTPAYTTGSYLAFIGTSGGATTLTNKVSGEGDLFIASNSLTGGGTGGTLTMNAASTYSGNTLINTNCTLLFGIANALPNTTNVIFNSLTGGASAQLAAIVNLNGFNQQWASLSNEARGVPANILIINNGSNNAVLTIGGPVTPAHDFGGTIGQSGVADISLVKIGANTLTLTGTNLYTGGTKISGGVLNVNTDAALGDSAGGLTIENNAKLQAGADISSSRTVTLGTGGGIIDTNAHNVTLDASSTVTGTSLTKTGNGTLTLSGANNYTGSTTVSGGTLNFTHTETRAAITINANSTLKLTQHTPLGAGAVKLIDTTGLTVNGTGKLDLVNNALIVRGGTIGTPTAGVYDPVSSPTTGRYAGVEGLVQTGFYNGGLTGHLWEGPGINSSDAAFDTNTNSNFLYSIGAVDNTQSAGILYGPGGLIGTSFAGVSSLTGAEILAKFTYFGDADLNGVVDGTDYSLIDNGFNSTLTGWINGDFDHNGVVDGTDYSLIDNAFNSQTGPLLGLGQGGGTSVVVPEPGSIGLLIAGTLCLSFRRRKSS